MKGQLLNQSLERLELNPKGEPRKSCKHMSQNYWSWEVMGLANSCTKSWDSLVTDAVEEGIFGTSCLQSKQAASSLPCGYKGIGSDCRYQQMEVGQKVYMLQGTHMGHWQCLLQQANKVVKSEWHVQRTEKELVLKLAYEGWILVRRKLGGVGSSLARDCMNKSADTEHRTGHITASVPSYKHFSVHVGEGAGGEDPWRVWHMASLDFYYKDYSWVDCDGRFYIQKAGSEGNYNSPDIEAWAIIIV